jgi:4-hydroxy-4-methyl-2-oxoglutarate aldolase
VTDLFTAAAAFPVATLYEANGGRGALPSAIRPIDTRRRLNGRAFTVECAPGDNLWLHRALLDVSPGDVLVCSVGGAYEHGYWGDVLTFAAMSKGVSGLVIDGGVRDADQIEELGFPVFSRLLCIRGTSKIRDAKGSIGGRATIGDVIVNTGDLISGDRDGAVAIAAPDIETAVRKAADREAKEEDVRARLRHGETTLQIYQLV